MFFFLASHDILPSLLRADDFWLSGGNPCACRLIDTPTGLGMTAGVVLAGLWNRMGSTGIGFSSPLPSEQNRGLENPRSVTRPRRLTYCLPMRGLFQGPRKNNCARYPKHPALLRKSPAKLQPSRQPNWPKLSLKHKGATQARAGDAFPLVLNHYPIRREGLPKLLTQFSLLITYFSETVFARLKSHWGRAPKSAEVAEDKPWIKFLNHLQWSGRQRDFIKNKFLGLFNHKLLFYSPSHCPSINHLVYISANSA